VTSSTAADGAEFFPGSRRLRGDRTNDLSVLAGRDWDAVLDVACYHPPVAARSVEALRDSVGRYVFVSSISVYADTSVPPVEGAAVLELAPERDDDTPRHTGRAAACECIVRDVRRPRLVVRPG
jgi:2'-hydroxyisoflavone reductase